MATQPPSTPPPAGAPGPAALPLEHRYRSLHVIATLLTIFGWFVLILGGIGVVIGAVVTGTRQTFPQGVLVLVVGAIYVALFALYSFAGAAIIRLAMAVEGKTRLTAEALTR